MSKDIRKLVFLIFIFFPPALVNADDPISVGEDVYRRYCIGCHGENGDGNGKASKLLVIKPRNFTTGVFKFKSTPQGALPMDEDLMRSIKQGLPGSSMPAYILVSEIERKAVIEYIKTFSNRWATEIPKTAIAIPAVPEYIGSIESILKGKKAYEDNGCAACHGDNGDGKGPASEELEDMWGNPVKPRNFKKGVYRSGSKPQNLFTVLSTGIEGTPMPAYEDITDDDKWHLISFILGLKGGR